MSAARAAVALLACAALAALGVSRCNGRVALVQELAALAGVPEPHTPGSGAPETLPLAEPLRQLRGAEVDLNRVRYTRTALAGTSPRIVLVLIPGFLGGAATFDPVARDLVRAMNGSLEVWAVDRRSNALEDRRGARHALAGAEAAPGDAAAVRGALAEGVRFYFPESDLDGDGSPDGAFPLPDAVPADGPSVFQRLAQDDARFMAHWGVDTYVRDWRELVLAARERVGPEGLVLFGGHSMGTTWTGVFAAYDFDPGPAVEAGHELVDGLLLLEGGGPSAPSPDASELATYRAAVEDLEAGTNAVLADPDPSTEACENPLGCTSDVFLTDLFGFIDAVDLGAAGEPPRTWGLEREVTDIDTLARTLFETSNASEWYFVSGRPRLDLLFGRDSSALGAPELLNVTRNARVDVPILAVGGSNGLTPTASAFDDYLGSVASRDVTIEILEGYSHLDVISAAENEAVPPILGWMSRLLRDRRLDAAAP